MRVKKMGWVEPKFINHKDCLKNELCHIYTKFATYDKVPTICLKCEHYKGLEC